jgi:thioredoxin-dependent peroxiredoxin
MSLKLFATAPDRTQGSKGDDVIILLSAGTEEARALFPAGWAEHTSYLRTVPQPEAAN